MIYVITPVYNRKEFTRNYLKALVEQTIQDFKVIIVDDGSTDGTSQMIEKEYPEVVLLKEEGDLWWAEATNVAVKYALEQGAEYIMTLNDDTLPKPDFMEKMIYWSNKKPDALLGGLAIDVVTSKPLIGGYKNNWKTTIQVDIVSLIEIDELKGLHEVDVFPGRGLLIPAKVFNNIGFYDSKNFPQTVADSDFAYRSKNAGYEIYCNCDAKIRIYSDESAATFYRNNKSWRNYYIHLFGLKGGGNLKRFTILVLKNCPKRYLPQYLLVGWSRRIGGYLKEWLLEIISKKDSHG